MAHGNGDDDLLRPLASLLSKSRKAQGKLAPGTWQHRMLEANMAALRLGHELLSPGGARPAPFGLAELEAAAQALSAMAGKAAAARDSFDAGTSPHSLQVNRLRALAAAQATVEAELRRRRGRHPSG